MGKIAVIDDDPFIRELLIAACEELEHEVIGAASVQEGLEVVRRERVDLVFLDVYLPDGNGLEMLPLLCGQSWGPEVIILTGAGNEEGAELAIKSGVWDYMLKPFVRQDLVLQIQRALDYHEKKMGQASSIFLQRDGIIGKSKALLACLERLAQCAKSDAGVLLTGETGTGKEVFARTLHCNSQQADGPFVIVDCTSLPESLVESILFGHVKGAFTGAESHQIGLIEKADKGTLFFDEIGELSLDVQKKLLRVIQEHSFRPLGKEREHWSDFRLLAATNRNLQEMVDLGAFRRDLYYRLNTFSLSLPPLRERKGDIEELSLHFLLGVCRKNRLPVKELLPETLEILCRYPWPGNVRELRNTMEKAAITDPFSPVVYPIHLPAEIRLYHVRNVIQEHEKNTPFIGNEEPRIVEDLPTLKEYRRIHWDGVERFYLKNLLDKTNGDIAEACAISGVSRSRLYGLLKMHGLSMSDMS